ncbi:MAG TPA: ribosome maturation factor RimM [Anaerolineaceae bacterium]|nr:ribosome maturation factor RimM [Anaerolineaceae bacterium]HPN51061.1 ribosome maturation factor RimM [Anaerolineaceae bacterium]
MKPEGERAPLAGQGQTGSPAPGEPVFLTVGRLRRAHGVQGEIGMEVLTDFPERLRKRTLVYIGEDHRPMRLASKRWKDDVMLISFEDIIKREDVALLSNQNVYVRTESLPQLPEGQYYHHQIIGLEACDESGARLGEVVDILETGANDVYVVQKDDGTELLLPVIDAVILQVDLEAKKMMVRPPEWEE